MLLELLEKRRSIRKFAKKAVEKEKIDLLLEAALRSPSSRGIYPWDFLVVDDPCALAMLAESKASGSSFVKQAPLAIVVCADPHKCDVWVEDCSIAALLLHLTAADLGLGSCWVQIRKRQRCDGDASASFLAGQLQLPAGYEVLALVAVGYPAEEKTGHERDDLLWQRVHHNRFSLSWKKSL